MARDIDCLACRTSDTTHIRGESARARVSGRVGLSFDITSCERHVLVQASCGSYCRMVFANEWVETGLKKASTEPTVYQHGAFVFTFLVNCYIECLRRVTHVLLAAEM